MFWFKKRSWRRCCRASGDVVVEEEEEEEEEEKKNRQVQNCVVRNSVTNSLGVVLFCFCGVVLWELLRATSFLLLLLIWFK